MCQPLSSSWAAAVDMAAALCCLLAFELFADGIQEALQWGQADSCPAPAYGMLVLSCAEGPEGLNVGRLPQQANSIGNDWLEALLLWKLPDQGLLCGLGEAGLKREEAFAAAADVAAAAVGAAAVPG